MRLSTTYRRGARAFGLCGLVVLLSIAAGCHKAAPPPPPPPAKPKTDAPKTNTVAVTETNSTDLYASVFEDLPPQKGKDPFFPASHRRDPAAPVTIASEAASAPVAPLLVLKGIVGTGKHSSAAINGEIMEVGDEAAVRVPNGHVRVRCIEIGTDYVIIQVEGESETKRLTMEQKKN